MKTAQHPCCSDSLSPVECTSCILKSNSKLLSNQISSSTQAGYSVVGIRRVKNHLISSKTRRSTPKCCASTPPDASTPASAKRFYDTNLRCDEPITRICLVWRGAIRSGLLRRFTFKNINTAFGLSTDIDETVVARDVDAGSHLKVFIAVNFEVLVGPGL